MAFHKSLMTTLCLAGIILAGAQTTVFADNTMTTSETIETSTVFSDSQDTETTSSSDMVETDPGLDQSAASSESADVAEESAPTTTSSSETGTTVAEVEVTSQAQSMPQALVGIWRANRQDIEVVITIHADGSDTKAVDGTVTATFQIDKVEEVGAGIYRWVGGENTSAINIGGLGGYGVKYDNGFTFTNGQFQPITWQTGANDPFDYSKGMYDEVFTLVTETSSSSSTTVQSQPQSATDQTVRVTPAGQLPATGDDKSILTWVGLALALVTGLVVGQGLKKDIQ